MYSSPFNLKQMFQIIIHPCHFVRLKLIASINCVWTFEICYDSLNVFDTKQIETPLKKTSKLTPRQQISIMNVAPWRSDFNVNGIKE